MNATLQVSLQPAPKRVIADAVRAPLLDSRGAAVALGFNATQLGMVAPVVPLSARCSHPARRVLRPTAAYGWQTPGITGFWVGPRCPPRTTSLPRCWWGRSRSEKKDAMVAGTGAGDAQRTDGNRRMR